MQVFFLLLATKISLVSGSEAFFTNSAENFLAAIIYFFVNFHPIGYKDGKKLKRYILHEGRKLELVIRNWDDLYRLTQDNIKGGFLEYMPQKTKKCEAKTVRVPLHEKALAILKRYENLESGKLLPFKQINEYNNGIKELLKRCGIDRMVTVLDTHGYKTVQKPLCEVASSHTARKTFVGNLYKQVPDPNLIASMSGHVEGSRAFARYRNIDDDMKRKLVEMIN